MGAAHSEACEIGACRPRPVQFRARWPAAGRRSQSPCRPDIYSRHGRSRGRNEKPSRLNANKSVITAAKNQNHLQRERISMPIKVGDRLPDTKFRVMTTEGPVWKTTDEVFKGRKVALFAVP